MSLDIIVYFLTILFTLIECDNLINRGEDNCNCFGADDADEQNQPATFSVLNPAHALLLVCWFCTITLLLLRFCFYNKNRQHNMTEENPREVEREKTRLVNLVSKNLEEQPKVLNV